MAARNFGNWFGVWYGAPNGNAPFWGQGSSNTTHSTTGGAEFSFSGFGSSGLSLSTTGGDKKKKRRSGGLWTVAEAQRLSAISGKGKAGTQAKTLGLGGMRASGRGLSGQGMGTHGVGEMVDREAEMLAVILLSEEMEEWDYA